MMNVVPVVPQRHHIVHIEDYLQPEQHLEIKRYNGTTIEEVVDKALDSKNQLWALVHKNGLTLGLSGMGSAPGIGLDIGLPWVLTTCHMKQYVRDFLKTSTLLNKHYSEHHSVLIADVDSQYPEGLRLMRFLGYQVKERIVSPAGNPFHRFIYRR